MKKLLFLLLMGPLAFAIAVGEPDPASGQSSPAYYGQDVCDATAQDTDFILSALSENTSSFQIRELSQLYCWPGPEKERYVSGTLTLMHSLRDIKYYETYFSAIFSADGAGNLSYYYQNEMYNFSAVFTQNEEQALDYTLKKMLIDSSIDGSDPVVWVQVRDFDQSTAAGIAYEEELMIKSNAPLRCLPGRCGPTQPFVCSSDKSKLSQYAGSFFYEPWCAGFIQLPLSQVRFLVGQFDSISYFSDVMRYQFQGSAQANTDLPALVSQLSNTRSICTDYEYKQDCTGYYIPTARFSASAWFSYDDAAYASFNLYGNVSGESELTVYLNGAAAGKYLEKAKASIESALSDIGVSVSIDFKNTTYYDQPMLAASSSGSGDASSGQAVAAEAVSSGATVGVAVESPPSTGKVEPGVMPPAYVYESYSFTANVKTPDVPLSGFDKFEGDFYTTYSRDNLNIVIGEPYLSLWNENVSFSPGKVTATLVLESDSNESASRALSEYLLSYGVSVSDWSLSSYPTGNYPYPILYATAGGAMVKNSGIAENALSAAVPAPAAPGSADAGIRSTGASSSGMQSAQGSFSDGFAQAVNIMRQGPASTGSAANGAAGSSAQQKPPIASSSSLSKYFIFALIVLVLAGVVLAVGRERGVMLDTDPSKVISSGSRLSILKSLNLKDKTLTDLANELNLSLPTVKEHMDILLKAGLVVREDTDRKWKYFSLTQDARRFLKNN